MQVTERRKGSRLSAWERKGNSENLMVIDKQCPWCSYGRMLVKRGKKAVRVKCTGKGCKYYAWIPRAQLTADEKKLYRVFDTPWDGIKMSHQRKKSKQMIRGIIVETAVKPLPPKVTVKSFLKDH